MVDEGTQDYSLDFYAELVTLRAYKKYIQKCNSCFFFAIQLVEWKFFFNFSRIKYLDFLSVSV